MNTRARLLRSCIAMLASIAMQMAALTVNTVTASETAAESAAAMTVSRAQHRPQVLFRADWGTLKNRLNGPADYRIVRNTVEVNADPDERFQVPFSTGKLTHFAVEATIAAGTPTVPHNHYFGLLVKGAFGVNPNAIALLYSHDAGTADDGSLLLWGGDKDHLLPGPRFSIDTGFHTYRAEVQGRLVRLLLDGREVIPWTAVATPGTGSLLGFMGAYTPLRIRTYRVFALSATMPRAQQDTRGWDGQVLTEKDVRLPVRYGMFRTNAAYATETKTTAVAVDDSGRVLGYNVLFASSAGIVEEQLNRYSTSGTAGAAFARSMAEARQSYSGFPAYREIDTGSVGPGAERFTYSYQHENNGAPAYRVVTLFHHGSYFAGVTNDARTDLVARNAVYLAWEADRYISYPHAAH